MLPTFSSLRVVHVPLPFLRVGHLWRDKWTALSCVGAVVLGYNTFCKVTPVILHGVVSPDHGVAFPDPCHSCPANAAHLRQSRTDFGLDCQKNVLFRTGGAPSRAQSFRCPANVAHLRQSGPDSGRGFQAKVLFQNEVIPFSSAVFPMLCSLRVEDVLLHFYLTQCIH